MALINQGGNAYVFDALADGATATCDFEDTIKAFMCNVDMVLLNTDNDEIFEMKASVKYELPNIFGYPTKLYIKNTSGSGIIPKFMILEYGDISEANPDYFKEEV